MGSVTVVPNTLYYGDNLDILRRHIASGSVDLVYLDPPFNSNAAYNVLFAEQDGSRAAAQVEVFTDTWRWDQAAVAAYEETVSQGGRAADALRAMRMFLGGSDMLAYLSMMAPRLLELRRVLRSTGSIYLHCDTAASAYLRVLMDAVFGADRFLNEITWKRTTAHNDPKRYGRVQDRLLYYSKSSGKTFNRVGGILSDAQRARYKYADEHGPYRAENLTAPHFHKDRTFEWRGVHPGRDRQWRFGREELERLYAEGRILPQRDGRPRKDGLKEYLADAAAPALQDIWTDIQLWPTDRERLGYPTQKPLALLERIISVSSNPGDVVLDPFCGCGTAIDAAQRLGRQWLGIDITHLAINLIKHRLRDAYGDTVTFAVVGEPTDVASATDLAKSDPYQFQWWALGLVGARPVEQKKGADRGIDGRLYFHEQTGGKTKQVVFSVKAGGTGVSHVRDLRGVVERENAALGILITMQDPTRPMRQEAAEAGSYVDAWGQRYPRLQLFTVDELLAGKKIEMPMFARNTTVARAQDARPALGT